MHKEIKCVVIKPDSHKKKKNKFPVVYLLHGWSGNFSNWIIKEPLLMNYADQYQCLIVCPDGAYASWYFDSPVDDSYRYETHVGIEVPKFIDSAYRTIPDRHHRAITGLSMGGHGAFWLAFRHADIFGAVASMSGGVDLLESKNKFDINKRIGDTTVWSRYTILNLIERYPKDSLEIFFDCGIEDIFIKGNRKLNEKLLQLKIPHDYTERPGKHDWNYWKNTIPYHLLFFRRFFDKNTGQKN
ncbi:MAG: alpha/beta hydrolase family protein [Bacteroidota bacterium]